MMAEHTPLEAHQYFYIRYEDAPNGLDIIQGDELDIVFEKTTAVNVPEVVPYGQHHLAQVIDVIWDRADVNSTWRARQYFKLKGLEQDEFVQWDIASATGTTEWDNLNSTHYGKLWTKPSVAGASTQKQALVSIYRLSPRVEWPLKFRLPNAVRGVTRLEIESINLKNVQTTHHDTPGDPGNYDAENNIPGTKEHPFYSLTIDEVFTGDQEVLSNVPGLLHNTLFVFPTTEQDLQATTCNIMAVTKGTMGDNSHAKFDFGCQFDIPSLTVHIRDPAGKYIKCQSADICLKLLHDRKLH